MRVLIRAGWRARPAVAGTLLAMLAMGIWLLVDPAGLAARERRSVLNGRFELVVGFLAEPAYEGEPNGLYLRVTDSQPPTPTPNATPTPSPGATPAPEAGTTLQAEVRYGEQTRRLDLVQDEADPAIYRAIFVPTQPGDYVFRITGTLAGREIAEEFHSSAETFPGVTGVGDVQFPADIPVGQGLLDAFEEAEERAARARTFGVVGVLLGVVGLLAGGLSVVLSRRPPPGGME